jgi:SAM-dependent methyltransferase
LSFKSIRYYFETSNLDIVIPLWHQKLEHQVQMIFAPFLDNHKIAKNVKKNMTYKTSQEHKVPNQSSLELIENVKASIEPDIAEMSEWYYRYVRGCHKRLAYDIDYVKKYVPQQGKILEFGAIPLLLTGGLQKLGYNVHGIDIAPERFAKAIASLNLKVSKVDIETEKLPFSDGEFDAIIFNELFEHLRINPIFTLKEVYRVMNPNGILLLSTPNLKSLRGIIDFLLKDRIAGGDIWSEYNKLYTLGHMGHVREYSTLEVCLFLEKIGFTINEVVYRGSIYPNKWQRIVLRLFPVLKLFPSLRPFMTIVAKQA